MQVRWTASAAADLEGISNYLFQKTPLHAPRLSRSLYQAISALNTFPNRGRLGKRPGTRELIIPSLPYIVVYEVSKDCVNVLRILHGAQQWPS